MMPDMDGYQVLRHLKDSEETKDISVMMLTVRKWSEDIQKAMELQDRLRQKLPPWDALKTLREERKRP
jgi:CheY-like chemotaxis protein